jgi:hypothetical protein
MKIDKGTSVAVVINRDWANLHGVRMFLRLNHTPEREIRGVDNSHVVFARMLDSEDPNGLWIELNTGAHEKDPTVKRSSFLESSSQHRGWRGRFLSSHPR